MHKAIFLISVSLLLTGCQQKQTTAADQADILIRNARVYTVDAQQPWAESVAIKGNKIEWVGSTKDAESHAGSNTKVIDAGGRMLLPGFIDSHFHVLLGGSPDVLSAIEVQARS